MKGISIIIPTLNRSSYLKNTLNDLFVQDFEYLYEILIVDQSTNLDQDIVDHIKGKENVNYFHITTFRGLPEARNFGWKNAKYDYVLYVDDDIQCKPNLLTEHFKILSNPNIGIVAGGITEAYKENMDVETGKFDMLKADPKSGFNKKGNFAVDHAKGCNFSITKKILKEVSGVDENLTKGAALYEETDLCLRVKDLGYQVWYNHDAHVVHLAADTGGCRVPEIDKYIFSLVRNRSIIIERHLKGIYKITSHLYLFKLVMAYTKEYKNLNLLYVYKAAKREGKLVGKKSIKCSVYEY